MIGDDDDLSGGRKRPIFTGDDLPDEDPIAPDLVNWEDNDRLVDADPAPIPPRWDEADDDYTPAPATGRLGLEDDDGDRLPWLESADDIDAEESFDTGRVIGFLVLGLLALGMIVGAVWFATNRANTGPADGSLIVAEKGPYKVPPENPGGKQFEGTGDTSFQVAQGGPQPAPTTAPSAAASTAAPAPTASATPSPKPTASASVTAAPAAGGVGVQVGAYTTAADAEKGWSALVARNSALSGLSHRVIEGQADFGRVFRLQAVIGDVAAANALCAKLKAAGQGCQVKK